MGLSSLFLSSTVTYGAHLYITKKMKSCEFGTLGCIHNTSFYLYIMNGPEKLECLSVASFSILLLCNTLTY
jgi:hypothetical protein